MWSASAELGLRCPLLLYWSLVPHAGQCVMPMACALASTCFLNCLCSLVLVLLIAFPLSLRFSFVCVVLGGGASQRQRDERLHRLTLFLLSLSFFLSFSFFSFLFLVEWRVLCVFDSCVVCAYFHTQCLLHTTTTVLLSPPHTVHC